MASMDSRPRERSKMAPKMAVPTRLHVAPGAAAGAPTFRAAFLVVGFARQTLAKWPFFEHAEQIASLAGQRARGCFGWPQKIHVGVFGTTAAVEPPSG